MARLQQYYKDTVVGDLVKQFAYKSVMEVPRITKITLNMGVGEAVADKKVLADGVKINMVCRGKLFLLNILTLLTVKIQKLEKRQ